MLSEPYTRIVSTARETVNPRAALRTAILRDHTITSTACRLYCLLDDYAGARGYCWPSQARLAADLGITDRHVRRLLRQLAAYVHERRGSHGARYYLAWCFDAPAEAKGTPIEHVAVTGHRGENDRTSRCTSGGRYKRNEPEHGTWRCAHCGYGRMNAYGLCAACCRSPQQLRRA